MDEKQNARCDGPANKTNASEGSPRSVREQGPRPLTPREIKAQLDPAAFYAREIPDAPTLKARSEGWSQNFRCVFHDEHNASFGVNLQSGAYRCFACGASGGSVIDFMQQRYGLTLKEVRQRLTEEWNLKQGAPAGESRKPRPPKARTERAALVPIPPEALTSRPQAHPKHGKPSAVWEYRDAAGRPLFFVLRFDPPKGRKQFAPLTWTEAEGWQWRAPPAPRPLYGLDRLAERPGHPVLFCEGEKSADAAAVLLPHLVAVTTVNGAQSPGKSDLAPVAGREVFVYPDADEAGADYAAEVARLALAAGARSVKVLDLDSVATDPKTGEPRELPAKWDAADALAEGWTAEAMAAAVRWRSLGNAGAETVPDGETEGANLPYPFELHRNGVYYRRSDESKGGKGNDPLYICPPFRVLAVSRNESGAEFGRLIEFVDLDGQTRREVVADRERQGLGDALRARLAALGFEVATHPETRRLFLDLLRRWQPKARARSVTRTGWTGGGVYVLPNIVIGEGVEPVILASEGERAAFAVRGTVQEWREHVGRLCVGNRRLVFAVSMAFAAPLLELIGAENGGFHLRGASTDASSSGKTTIQRVAASVCGSPQYLQRWRATDNSLETTAENHNDALLLVDELAQLDPRAAGDAAYMLGNGAGKSRMDRSGDGMRVRRWRLLFLSSGEIGLGDHMAAAQKRTRAGQEVRMAEIPADAGCGLGVFEQLHGYADGGALAAALTEAAASFHGAPLVEWVRAIIRERPGLSAKIKSFRGRLCDRLLGPIPDPPNQVRRVALRFALVGVAGELATDEGLTGWPKGAALDAAEVCFNAWFTDRGGAVPSEERELVRQVRRFFAEHSNRFLWKSRKIDDDHAPGVPRACGFKDAPDGDQGELVFYVFPEIFEAEVVAGFGYREAAEVLVRRGMLKPGPDGRPTRKERLPGFANPTRVYVFGRDLGGDDGL